MIIDFWTTNMNPITLFSKLSDVREKASRVKTESLRVWVTPDLSQNPDYILNRDAQKLFGLGAQRIREEVQSKGVNFKIYTNQKAQYYLRSDLECIEIVIPTKFEVPEDYISGPDVRAIKGWTGWDLHNKASKNGWQKIRYKGNVTYYLKSEVL